MNEASNTTKEILLNELNETMDKRSRCTLKLSATQAVPGKGVASAEVIFIGEAPGKNEDLQGVPFIGAAGKFLDEMLASIQMERSDVYITNIVKYRPPENRDPSPDEIRDCEEWLHAQINIINPSLIVTLGRHALNHFFPELSIGDVHGTMIRKSFPEIGIRSFLPLYHPAAALYNGSMRNTLKDDFLSIPKALKTIRFGEQSGDK
jgi:uracil-DNA glycosylase family 4